MKIFTSGFEMSTSITNVFILMVSLYGAITIKKDKLWRLFFVFMSIDSFMGVIAHGIQMSKTVNDIMWVIMTILFAITVNIIFGIFSKCKTKYITILSIILSIVLLIEFALDMYFLYTFDVYIIIIVLLSIYFLIKNDIKNKKLIIAGLSILFIAGYILFSKTTIGILNYNGLAHIILTITLIIFIIANKKH